MSNVAQVNVIGIPRQYHSFEIPISVELQGERHKVLALIDSGATHSFIHHDLVRKWKWKTKRITQELRLLNVDGTENSHGRIQSLIKPKVHVSEWQQALPLLVTNLHQNKVILGANWLYKANPSINWTTQEIAIQHPLEINHISIDKGISGVPLEYKNYSRVFSDKEAERLPVRKEWDMGIELEIPPEEYVTKIGKGAIYAMTSEERKELSQWIDDNERKGYIRKSTSPIAAPVFFIPKKDGKKRLVQNYKRLNKHIRRDSYPIPIMRTLADRVEGAKIFTKIDLRWGYNNVRIKEGDEWKAAFTTPRGLYEPTVMLFGMTNSPAVFQRMMDNILRGTEHFTVVYLDDILIYSRSEQEHIQHVKEVLQILQDNDLFAKPEKCIFHTDTLEYLGTWIEKGTLTMDKDKIEAIVNWPTPKRIKDVRSFLGFANFYRHFIKGFTLWSRTLTHLTKKDVKWKWEQKHQEAFEALKEAFTKRPVLIIPDDDKPFELETDASDYAIGAVLSQRDNENKLHPVAYYSSRMDEAERNYEIFDKEMMAVMKALKKWRHHLQGSPHPIKVFSDHQNLAYFKHPHDLSPRQARWFAKLLNFPVEFHHQPAVKSARTDALSRNPLWKPTQRDNQNMILIQGERDKNPEIRIAQIPTDPLLEEIRKEKQVEPEVFTALENLKKQAPNPIKNQLREWELHDELILYKGRIYVPNNKELKRRILHRHHDHPAAGHPGREKTVELVSREYWWPSLTTFVHNYVDGCEECQRNKILPRRPLAIMGRHDIPDTPWQIISVDMITDLPTSNGKDSILCIVDYHTKQAHAIGTNKTLTAPQLADLYLQHVWKLHGTPQKIVSDRGPQFASEFTRHLQRALKIESALSTAHHPQTDGQTERFNQTLETYLRIFTNYHQKEWEELLPYAEYSYNSQKHSATGYSPFFLLYGYDPTFEVNTSPVSKVPSVEDRRKMLELLRKETVTMLERTQELMAQRQDNGITEEEYERGDKVWLEATNIKTTAPTKKLAAKRLGPFKVIEKIGKHAYKLSLPPGMKNVHPVFHKNLLRAYHHDAIKGRRNPPPAPIEITPSDERYEVEEILDSKKVGKGIQYLIKWKGYHEEESTWEPRRNIDDAEEELRKYHKKFPHKPHHIHLRLMRTLDPKTGVMSRTQFWTHQIHKTIAEIRNIRKSN